VTSGEYGPSSHPLGRIETGLSALAGIVVLVIARAYPLWREQFVVACPLLEIFGLPCPTCGGTRAFAALAAGNAVEAFAWNPLAALLAATTVIWLPAAALIVAGRLPLPAVPTRLPLAVRCAIPLLIVANWVYLLIWFRG